jgi:hypothetical protein
MRALHRLQGRFVPFGQAIARTLDEILARYRWKSFQVRHRIFARSVDHAVHKQQVFGGIDRGDPAVMALEMKAGRREVAEGLVEGREAPRGIFVCSGEAHARLSLELRSCAISAVGCDRAALLLRRIGRHVEIFGAGWRLLSDS